MGWFRRKQSSDDEVRATSDEPYVADDQTVARVAQLMKAFDQAVSNGRSVFAVGGAIYSAAGMPTFEQMLTMKSPPALDRPWKMLASVAHRVVQSGDHVLAGQIFGFVHYWNTVIAPQLDRAALLELPMGDCPAIIAAEIARVASGPLRQLPDSQVIFGEGRESITAGTLAQMAASVLAAPQ